MSTAMQIDAAEAVQAAAPPTANQNGLHFQFKVAPNESQADFDTLLTGLRAEYQPGSLTENVLVDDMARSEWMSRRVQNVIDKLMENGSEDPKLLAVWLRFFNTYRRGFSKSLAELLKLRAERRKDQIGFERQKIATAAEARKLQVAEARMRVQKSQIAAREIATRIKSARLAQFTNPNRAPETNIRSSHASSL